MTIPDRTELVRQLREFADRIERDADRINSVSMVHVHRVDAKRLRAAADALAEPPQEGDAALARECNEAAANLGPPWVTLFNSKDSDYKRLTKARDVLYRVALRLKSASPATHEK